MAKRKKMLGQEIRSIHELKTVQGVLGEIKTIITPNFPDGIQYIELADKQSGEIHAYWLDGGLRGKLNMSGAQPGMWIEIEHLGKKPFTTNEGKQVEVNDYAIYELEE